SCRFVRRPIRIRFTSPRTTTFIQTLLSAPMTTSPMICADGSMYASPAMSGEVSLKRLIIDSCSWQRAAGSRSFPLSLQPSASAALRAACCQLPAAPSDSGQRNPPLGLVLPALVLVRRLAHLVALEEQHLRDALVGVDLRRQRRGVRDLDGHVPFPLRLERRDVDDDAAARVGRLAEADRQH